MESVGRNVKAEVRDSTLVIEVDLREKGSPSASGKTMIVGTTNGFVNINGVMVGLNVCRKPTQ